MTGLTLPEILMLSAAGSAFVVTAFVLRRETQSSRARTSFALGMVLLGVESLMAFLSSRCMPFPEEVLAWQRWRLVTMSFLPGCWLLFSLTYGRGDEKEYLRRWRHAILAAFLLPGVLVAMNWNGLMDGGPGEADSLRLVELERPGIFLNILFIGFVIPCLMNLESTLRCATGIMRWRVKYMVVGLGLLLAVRCYSASQDVLYSAVNQQLAALNACALLIGIVFMALAVTRGTFHATDIYPSHGVIYHSITVIVAGVYLVVVGLLAEVIARFGGFNAFPAGMFMVLLGVIGVTVLMLSDRVRQQIKRFVTHHFNRPQYDYRRVWALFSERTGSLTEPGEYCRAVVKVIADTFEVLSVTLWLVDEKAGQVTYGGSTSFSEPEGRALLGSGEWKPEVMGGLLDSAVPTPVLGVGGELGDWFRKLGQKRFPNGGDYYVLPLVEGNEALGILILGDRVSGFPFTTEEFELLTTIGNQVVANLRSIRLSRHLGEAQKLEAFQTMSAFFVHDLKNTASTLSLMLQNLPKHFDDPAFRRDALLAVSKSVDKINGLVGRLGSFRQKIEINPAAIDVNALLEKALSGLDGLPPGMVVKDLNPVPRALADAEQIQKVIVNLILNARDASPSGGTITVGTSRNGAWVVVSVCDHGCGMSAEFIAKSLFRPFQTTKKEGIGIGLFHSRMIVDAHHGRMEVESREREGSAFRVFLPAAGGNRET